MKLKLKKHKQEGDLAWEYNPFYNMIKEDNSISNFDTDELNIDMSNPLNIECQPSYDGTVNLIINDDKNPPRIINSRFSKIEDNRYRVITRNQREQTNLYKEGKIDSQTRLFRNLNSIPVIDLRGVSYYGQLESGTYTFYVKLADNDYNKTDIVAESSQIPIYKGTITNPSTICGGIKDEATDKSIKLRISNIDGSFQKAYLYFTRETSDNNGIRITEAKAIVKPYDITNSILDITINGFEETLDINVEELNIKYNMASSVKTQAQVQNMLFFGNITEPKCDDTILQNLSYYIEVGLKQSEGSIGYIDEDYSTNADISKSEYYNPQNVYYKLGYWPEEIYRLGVVYILNDDSLSPVYNLRGCNFTTSQQKNFKWEENGSDISNKEYTNLYQYEYKNNEWIIKKDYDGNKVVNYLPKEDFISILDNTIGVFKNSKLDVFSGNEVRPLYYEVSIRKEVLEELHNQKIKGYFFVRQKRIPIILGQGLSVGVNKNCYIPMLWNGSQYITEGFLSNSTKKLTSNISSRIIQYNDRIKNFNSAIQSSALLSLDAPLIPQLQSTYNGSEFIIEKWRDTTLSNTSRRYKYKLNSTISESVNSRQAQLVFVNEDTPLVTLDSCGFSTRAGNNMDLSQVTLFNQPTTDESSSLNPTLVRGIFCPIIGTNVTLEPACLYNIKVHNYNETYLKDYFSVRGNDKSPFFAISNRYELQTDTTTLDIYRGDCYTNTITIRYNRNFTDPDMPIMDTILDEDTWRDNFYGIAKPDKRAPIKKALDDIKEAITGKESKDSKQTDYLEMNRGDVNAVPMGIWVTFKCLSNYNLGLRSQDEKYLDERAKMGNARSFYPVSDISTKSSAKIPESSLLNDGYSNTVGRKRNFIYDNIPYIKDQFDNRIMFSNIQENDAFRNAYRIFQGLSYKDIDRQYGAIVKLIPWKENLLCVFEHGLGLVPINQKALLSTTTGQSIHLYGAGVLQSQVTVISPDFGSFWEDSIVRTPVGIYGVDTDAKKIWRYSDNKGFEIISDFKIQRFLNDHILLREKDKYPTIALLNVKTHFNNYKGDVMFTFYNDSQDETWNLCYNERIGRWVTKYTWTPLYSENINNIYWSLDRERAKLFSYIYTNRNTNFGIRTKTNTWDLAEIRNNTIYKTDITLKGYSLADTFDLSVKSIKYSYLDNGNEVFGSIPISDCKWDNGSLEVSIYKTKSDINIYYLIINVLVTPKIKQDDGAYADGIPFYSTIGAVYNIDKGNELLKQEFASLLGNGFYVHGRSGIFDELNYQDEDQTNQCMPTKWYDKQEPFEFEFVVNGEIGMHKIFNDLIIISNNVEPESLEYEIIGDVYNFNKAGIYWNKEWDEKYNPILKNSYQLSQAFKNAEIKWDNVLNTYSIKVNQDCKDIIEYGRLQGNIQYKEDSFYTNIEPIEFKNKVKQGEIIKTGELQSTRIRDKFMKVRVKYSGTDTVIITALHSLYTLSYS